MISSALFSKVVRWCRPDSVRAPEQFSVTCDCLQEALPILAEQLKGFGCDVLFANRWSGIGASEAGEFVFKYRSGRLTVTVTKDFGHFPRLMLIGGIKQTIGEANEIVRRAADARFETSQESAEA